MLLKIVSLAFFALIFFMKLKDHSTQIWRSRNFWRNLAFATKRVKMALNGPTYMFRYYSRIFYHNWLIRFVSYFAWSWVTISNKYSKHSKQVLTILHPFGGVETRFINDFRTRVVDDVLIEKSTQSPGFASISWDKPIL